MPLVRMRCLLRFIDAGKFASQATGPAMAVSIGYALQAPPLVMFTLAGVGVAANTLGGGGTLGGFGGLGFCL